MRRTPRGAVRGIARNPWAVVAAFGLVLFALWAISTRTSPHHVRVAFDDAVSIAPGLDVIANGQDVGKVDSVGLVDGRAVVKLGINDDSVWPLHQGTTATIRFGSTVGNGTRRIEIDPGPPTTPPIPEDGAIGTKDSTTPTEFDQLFGTLNAQSREDLGTGQRRGKQVLQGEGSNLGAGIKYTAPALNATADIFQELSADSTALSQVVERGDRVTSVLAARAPRISALMNVAAQTFSTFASNSTGVQKSIEQLAPTFRETRATLARLDPSIDKLQGLMTDIAPGARALRPLAAVARPAFANLRRTVPDALATIRATTAAAPQITQLLSVGSPFVRTLRPTFAGLSPIASCIRPYSPELAGFFANWAGFSKNLDATSHYFRVRAVAGDTSLTDTPAITTDEFVHTSGATYAGLRPPGLNSGHPWFLPQCGVGPDVLDPAKDWEDGR